MTGRGLGRCGGVVQPDDLRGVGYGVGYGFGRGNGWRNRRGFGGGGRGRGFGGGRGFGRGRGFGGGRGGWWWDEPDAEVDVAPVSDLELLKRQRQLHERALKVLQKQIDSLEPKE